MLLQLLDEFWVSLFHPLVNDVAEDYGGLSSAAGFYFAEEEQFGRELWNLLATILADHMHPTEALSEHDPDIEAQSNINGHWI